MDVDHFKTYNDTNGHPAGDELLQRLSALLEINLRATDVLARYGGEEFIVLLLDTGPEEGYATASKLQQVVATQPLPLETSQPGGKLTISVGIAFFPQDATASEPDSEIGMKMMDNGVAAWMDMDFGDFRLRGDLAKLKIHDAPVCQ